MQIARAAVTCVAILLLSNAARADDPVLPAATPFVMRLTESVSSRDAKPGSPFVFVLDAPIGLGAREVFPQGLTGVGRIVSVLHAGRGRTGALTLRVDSIGLNDGRTLKFTGQILRITGQSARSKMVEGLVVTGGDVRIDPSAVIHASTTRAVTATMAG